MPQTPINWIQVESLVELFILNQSETNDLGATVVLWSLSTALNILPRISFSITNIHKPTWPADGFHRSSGIVFLWYRWLQISASRLPFFWPNLLAQDRVSFSFWNSISWQSKCKHSLYQTRGKKTSTHILCLWLNDITHVEHVELACVQLESIELMNSFIKELGWVNNPVNAAKEECLCSTATSGHFIFVRDKKSLF